MATAYKVAKESDTTWLLNNNNKYDQMRNKKNCLVIKHNDSILVLIYRATLVTTEYLLEKRNGKMGILFILHLKVKCSYLHGYM